MMVMLLVNNEGDIMAEVSTAEAKKHLSDLLQRVQSGESFTITRYGKPVATLNPPRQRAPDLTKFREEHGRTNSTALDTLLRMRDEERF